MTATLARSGMKPSDILARANAVLETVADPELPFLTVSDMGILRDVRIAGDTLEVAITLPIPGVRQWISSHSI